MKKFFMYAALLALITTIFGGKFTDDRCGEGCTYPTGPNQKCGKPCVKNKKYHLGHRCQEHVLKGG